MREITYMKATLEGLSEEMARNPRIFVMGEGIGKRGGNFHTTAGLYDIYGPDVSIARLVERHGPHGAVGVSESLKDMVI